jgi:hypothetical protein
MTLEENERDKFDLIGNDRFQQQWVPEFIPEPPQSLHLKKPQLVAKQREGPTNGEIPATTHMYRLRAPAKQLSLPTPAQWCALPQIESDCGFSDSLVHGVTIRCHTVEAATVAIWLPD